MLLLLAASLACFANAQQQGKRLLVLLENKSAQEKYSQFFGSLASAGFAIDYKPYREKELKLREYDTWLYDHLAIFAPKAEGKCDGDGTCRSQACRSGALLHWEHSDAPLLC